VPAVRSHSTRFAAAWLLGAVLGVLALSHVPAAASLTGTSADTISGSKIVAMPLAKRLQPASADLGHSVAAVLPAALVATVLTGVAVVALTELGRQARSGPPPRGDRGPPVALQ
jgi:hypothetical protein